ncbi:MAG: metal-dependent hydrolase [Candidatus Hodarchaeaceae archaeon]|nr:metal-dependent hydrolase [Candidatus Hodarchaeaceae archaeon]
MILAHITVPLILYGIFPDFHLLALLVGANISSLDVLPTLLRKKPPKESTAETHAATILHTLFFFAILFVPFYFGFNLAIALSFMIGGFTHVLIDALDEKGRMLLYPISKKFYGPRIFTYDFWIYVTDRRIFTLEATLCVVAYVVLLVR